MTDSAPDSATPDASNPRNGVENAVFGVSLVLVLALLAALATDARRSPHGPADVRVTASPVADARATVTVRNAGGAAAEDVRVEACGRGGPAGPDVCAEAQVPYVPAGAERRAVVGFAKAPGGPLAVRVVSYLDP